MRKKAWTGIHFLEKTSYYDGKKSYMAILWALLSIGSFIMIQVSSFSMFFETLSFEFEISAVYVIMIAGTLVLWVLSVKWQLLLGAYILIIAGSGLYIWKSFDTIGNGFLSIYDRIYELVTVYYSGGSTSTQWSGHLQPEVYMTIALLLLLYGSLFAFAIKKVIPSVIPGIIGILGALLVGKTPAMPWFALFLAAICVMGASCYHQSRFGKYSILDSMSKYLYIRGSSGAGRKIGAKAGLCMVFILVFSMGSAFIVNQWAGAPKEETLKVYRDQVKGWLKEKNVTLLNEKTNKDRGPAKGGINGGDLASVGDLYYHGDEQIKVMVENLPRSTLYIKGYVGGLYDNSRWNMPKGGEYEPNVSELTDLLNIPYQQLSEDTLSKIRIEKLASFGDFGFMPYAAFNENIDGWISDLYLSNTGRATEYAFSPSLYDYKSDFSWISEKMNIEGELLQTENRYRDYAYSAFTQVPEDVRPVLNEFTQNVLPNTLEEKIIFVRQRLKSICTYSLTPGNLPEGRDFTEYFLMENKTGYCMHFATAATLMLRNMGVPARYVEGYIISPGSFKASDYGVETTVYDHQAHAWTEVYLDGFGWVPVEMTPAYIDDSDLNEDLQPQTQTDTDESPQSGSPETKESKMEESASPSPGVNNNHKDNDPNGQYDPKGSPASDMAAKVLKVIFMIVMVVIILIAAIVVRAAAIHRNRQSQMQQPNKRKALIGIYNHLLQLLSGSGYPYSKDGSIEDYIDGLAGRFEFIDGAAFKALVEAVNRAAFSKDGIDLEEWQNGLALYKTIRKTMYQRQGKLKRLYLKYIITV